MIRISKGKEPRKWIEFRTTPGVEDFESKPELVESLEREQGYICAYCMRRIPVKDRISNEDHRIEHIKCQERYKELKFDYNNLVICCPGAISEEFHCDRSKDDKDISFSPFDQYFIDTLSYTAKEGRIKSSNPQWDKEINHVLHLNNERLMLNRREVLNVLISKFPKDNSEFKAFVDKTLREWSERDKEGKYKEYCGIVIWYMKRKSRKLNTKP